MPSLPYARPRLRTRAALRRARLLGAVLAAGATAAGCGRSATAPAASFSLATERTSYAPGDAAQVRVENHGDESVSFGACEVYAIDQRAGDAWREVYRSPTDGVCIMVLYVLPAGGSFPLTVRLPQTLTPAEYRVRFVRFEPAATNAFAVR